MLNQKVKEREYVFKENYHRLKRNGIRFALTMEIYIP